MPSRFLTVLACAAAAGLALAGFLAWRNSPAQVAKRYLDKLARSASVYPEDSALNRRFRTAQLDPMLADPLEVRFPESHVSGTFEKEHLLAGYLSLVADATYFQVIFKQVQLEQQTPTEWLVQARLTVRCDAAADRFPADQPVAIVIRREANGCLLTSIRARPAAAGS